MMKKRNRIIALGLASVFGLTQTSCLGTFALTNKVYDWNQQATDNKFVNNLIFWGLLIVPVYSLSLIGDAIIFNLIEFWSGSNPIAMKAGEIERHTVKVKGVQYEMTATQNRFDIKALDGKLKGETTTMIYTPENQTWNKLEGEDLQPLAQYIEEDNQVKLFFPSGEVLMDADQENLAVLKDRVRLELEETLASK